MKNRIHQTQPYQILGLTGGIATGKSTVATILRQMRIPVICTDEIAHALTKKKSPALKEIFHKFGPLVFNADKTLNRSALARIVFANLKKQKILEKILHPRIKREVMHQIRKRQTTNCKLMTIDVPLLFEAGWNKMCDKTICVTAPQKLQIERLKKYRQMTRKEALTRIKAQMPLKEKAKRADWVIENKGTISLLKRKIQNFLKEVILSRSQ